jgi:hypothetical protein
LSLLVFSVSTGPVRATTRVAVMNLKAKTGVSVVVLPLINELFCAKLPALGNYEAITGETIDNMLEKSGDPDLMECNSTDCYYLIGSGLEADLLLAGTISKSGEAFTVQLMLLDIGQERIVREIAVKYEGEEVYLVDMLEDYLKMVLGMKKVPRDQRVKLAKDDRIKEKEPEEEVSVEKKKKKKKKKEKVKKEKEIEEKEEYAEEEGFVDRRKVTNIDKLSLMDRKIARSKKKPEKGDPLFVNKGEEDYSIDEYELFRWSETNVKYFLFGGGGGAILVEDPKAKLFDMFCYDVRVGYQIKRVMLMAEFRQLEITPPLRDSVAILTYRILEEWKITGSGIKFGFEMFQMFEKWLTVTPCLCAGYFDYYMRRQTDQELPGGGAWNEGKPYIVTKRSYFGASIRFDIGKRWHEFFGGYLTIEPQLMYVPEVIFIINVGFKGVI